MKKLLMVVFVVFILLTINFTGYASGEKVLELTAATFFMPNQVDAQALHLIAKRVGELSNGQIKMTVYDSAALYPQDAEFDALANGLIDIHIEGLGDKPNLRYPAMFKSAYLFSGREHAMSFYQGEMGLKVFEDYAKHLGVRPLGTIYLGVREMILNRTDEIKTPQDLKGVKLRMPGGADWTALGEALGATPTPIPFNDVYMALKTGLVDAAENELDIFEEMKWAEAGKQIVLTEHVIWVLHPAFNEAKWKSLTDQQREWIQQASDEACEWASNQHIEAEAKMIDIYKSRGIIITTPDKQAFVEYAANYYKTNKEITKEWNWEIYDYCLSGKK